MSHTKNERNEGKQFKSLLGCEPACCYAPANLSRPCSGLQPPGRCCPRCCTAWAAVKAAAVVEVWGEGQRHLYLTVKVVPRQLILAPTVGRCGGHCSFSWATGCCLFSRALLSGSVRSKTYMQTHTYHCCIMQTGRLHGLCMARQRQHHLSPPQSTTGTPLPTPTPPAHPHLQHQVVITRDTRRSKAAASARELKPA
jgi:hypothetical protein